MHKQSAYISQNNTKSLANMWIFCSDVKKNNQVFQWLKAIAKAIAFCRKKNTRLYMLTLLISFSHFHKIVVYIPK